MPEYYHHEIIRDEKGKFLGAATIAMSPSSSGGFVHYGVAFCSPLDNFSRRKGRSIAKHRMLTAELNAANCQMSQMTNMVMDPIEPSRSTFEGEDEDFASAARTWRESLYSQFTHCMAELVHIKNTPHWFRHAFFMKANAS